MAHLLGSKFCIESLCHDVNDVEEINAEIASRVGVVKAQSWKFPDKSSSDLNVSELLAECCYDENDEESNQVSHVLLYDLVIDRLLYTLHSFTRYNELLLSPKSASPDKNNSKPSTSMSAGLTTKRCWSRMTQLASVMQQMAQEVERSKEIVQSSERLLLESKQDNTSPDQSSPPLSSEKRQAISHEIAHRSTQSEETAYSSCETCARTQTCLHEVGKSIVKLCKSQGLPTALEDYIAKQTDSSLMSIAETLRWKNLQTKDLSRVDRHLESLVKQIKPMKEEVAAANKQESEAKAEVQRLTVLAEYREKEFADEQRRREQKLHEKVKMLQAKIADCTEENSQLKEDTLNLKEHLSDIKDELLKNHREFIQTENEKVRLKAETIENRKFQKDAMRLQVDVNELSQTVKELEERLKMSFEQLEKEVAKNTTLSSHEQAMQEKQNGLLKRLDELDEECEDLRERLAMAEEERDAMEEEAGSDEQQTELLEKKLKAKEELTAILQQDKNTLETRGEDLSAQVAELQTQVEGYMERERLLVAYPDLHRSEIQLPDSSGDVYTDMQRQIEANNLRISLLEKENRSLTKTLSNISLSSREASESSYFVQDDGEQYHNENQIQPIQLWKKEKDDDSLSYSSSQLSASGRSKKISSKSERYRHSDTLLSDKSHQNNVIQAYRNIKQQQKESQVRSSFHIGPGKQRSKTPSTSTPNSGRSALLKPWT